MTRLGGVVAAIALVGTACGSGDDDSAAGEVFAEAESVEVFLEPADEVGDDAFTEVAFALTPEVEIDVDVPADDSDAVGAERGSTPGLYGGTQDDAWCDVEAMGEFLSGSPDHAEAFVQALVAEDSLRWDGPGDPGVDDLDEYLSSLTPVLLIADTRVTNHGYRDGQPLPFQAVLQAGTAVLVDTEGVPRARCACGNPLTAPTEVPGTVSFSGDRWSGFDTRRLLVVRPATAAVDVFVLVDVGTGDRFERPVGTTGGADRPVGGQTPPATTAAPTTTAPPTTAAPTTAAPAPPVTEEPGPVRHPTVEDAIRAWAEVNGFTPLNFAARFFCGFDGYCASRREGEYYLGRQTVDNQEFDLQLLDVRGSAGEGWYVAGARPV